MKRLSILRRNRLLSLRTVQHKDQKSKMPLSQNAPKNQIAQSRFYKEIRRLHGAKAAKIAH